MNIARTIIAFVALAATAADAAITADFPTLPNDAWYRVEVIVFERVADPAPTEEVLVLHAPRTLPFDVIAFDDDASRAAAYPLDADTRASPTVYVVAQGPNTAAPAPVSPTQPTPAERAAKLIGDYQGQLQARSYRPEPNNTYLLAGEDGRLQRSGVYRVLLHRAWIQPVPDRDRLQPMLIQIAESDGRRIDGYLGITRGRYLHMDTRLWYESPAVALPTEPKGADSNPGYMEMREQRRMRSGELHYLDHPKFGVLARVDPVQPPDSLVAELARLAALAGQPAAPAPVAAQ